MSDQEKLKEYMRENAPKAKEKKPAPPPPTPKKVQLKTPLSWYTREIMGEIIANFVFGSMLSLLVYAAVYFILDV
ncbi:MAG TPA: hypothetical protein VK508_20935 [Cyclobacteriaceae bacterium]|nr:hypothetical protein [Cyclobacteriaceae bacterium]